MRKPVLTLGLLAFVAASVLAPIVREYVRLSCLTQGSQAGKPDGLLAALAPDGPQATVVCYLRSRFRCPACNMLETCSRDVVEQQFAAEAIAGTVVWKPIDYQTPGNEHFLTDFQLPTGGVVLIEFRDGKPLRWNALLHAWNLTDNQKTLASYLEQSIRQFREEGR